MPVRLLLAALVLVLLGAALSVAAGRALREKRWLRASGDALLGALLFALALLAATITVAIRGYRALTHEQLAATVRTEPVGPQRFRATVRLADGRLAMFDVAGDELYVDAHILKWHPWLNLLGVHTGYELDRIGGRYETLTEERTKPRTVESLAPERLVDAFELARRYRVLRPLVDAEYGSATFIGARVPATLEVRVSTTGLLVRRVTTGLP